MAQALSVHIGLNVVDPNAYPVRVADLAGCLNDARDMESLAAGRGYSTTVLLDGQATRQAVIDAIELAGDKLEQGDALLVTYSGHGGQQDDADGDEDDALDETWCLYDGELLDDELALLWARFRPGVRIFFLSDSCHSGTVARAYYRGIADQALREEQQHASALPSRLEVSVPLVRTVPPLPRGRFRGQKLYAGTLRMTRQARRRSVTEATVISISGCRDDQLSSDGDENGLFTQRLLEVWANGSFSGSHRAFADAIVARMPADQTPEYRTFGADSPDFEAQQPFTATPPGGAAPVSGGTPSVTAPATATRLASPPELTVDTAGAPYYVLEAATDPALFDQATPGRSEDTWYATYDDIGAPARMTGTSCRLPDSAWQRLSAADTVWWRVGTTLSEEDWTGWSVSTPDGDGSMAPSTSITGGGVPVSSVPSITVPALASRLASSPELTVDTAGAPYYVLEATTDPVLFDQDQPGRTEDTWYSTYDDASAPARLTGTSCRLPDDAWERLSAAAEIWYRVGTTTSEDDWTGWTVSTGDSDGESASSTTVTD